MQNWDDLRFLLAVHKGGTMSAAARLLHTNVATVSRRIERLAQELGGAPFVKTPAGWQPSAQAQDLLEAAATFEGELARERNVVAPSHPDSLPQLKLGVAPVVMSGVLLPRIAGIGGVPGPAGRIGLEIVERLWETGLGNHDLVVQTARPESGRLAVRRVGALRFRVWRWQGEPIDRGWIALTEAHDDTAPIVAARRLLPGPPVLRVQSFVHVLTAARQLRLPAALPEVMVRDEPGLVPLDGDGEVCSADYWMMYHLSRRGDPAVQAAAEWIGACFRDVETMTPLAESSSRAG